MTGDPIGRLEDLAEDAAAALRGALEAELASQSTVGAVTRFLGSRLHPAYGVRRAIVVGEREAAEPTFDCLIVDPRGAPSLPVAPGVDLVLADAVYGAVEIADGLKPEILAMHSDRIASLKRIHRRPLFQGDELVNPYLGILVARGGLDGDDLLEALARENEDRPFEEQIDLVCVLDRGLLGHAEVATEGTVSLELPLQASPRWRLAWIQLGERALLGLFLALAETLAARSLRPPRMHMILRALRSRGARALPLAHGIDRGE